MPNLLKIHDCGLPVEGYSADAIFDSFQLSGTFPSNSDVYAGALGSGLSLLQPDSLRVSSNSLTISGYDRPLLSASLWARVNTIVSPTEECGDRTHYFIDVLVGFIAACVRLYINYYNTKQNNCKR